MSEPVLLTIEEVDAGKRLDVFLAERFPNHSRVSLRRVISADAVQVDGRRAKPAYRLNQGQQVSVSLPDLPREGPVPEAIPLAILYEDDWLVAIDKPPGMVVHPGKGHWSGTLTAALAYHFEQLSSVGGATRPGIVHRLDRDTSGVIVVAKHDQAHLRLAEQFAARSLEKEYFTLVVGRPDRDRDVIEQPIGPHPYQREKMAIRENHPASRPARTFYEIVERFAGFAAVKVLPKTGRTHQIRVHLAHVGMPVLCDKLYGGRANISQGEIDHTDDDTPALERQALHARRLVLAHPEDGRPLEFVAPLPADIERTLEQLRQHRAL